MKREVQLIIITALFSSFLSVCGSGLYFYFNTTASLDTLAKASLEHKTRIEVLEKDNTDTKIILASIEQIKADSKDTKEDVKEMRRDLYNFVEGFYKRAPRN
jgi:hypothetical protein